MFLKLLYLLILKILFGELRKISMIKKDPVEGALEEMLDWSLLDVSQLHVDLI